MVATWKTELVDQLASQIKAKKVVGVVGIDGVPSKQMQMIRGKISSDADLVVSRKSIVKRAFEKAGMKEMADHISGTVGVIMSDLNPFQLEKLLDSNKSKAPAKAGAIAPFDLVVPEGDTGLPAGPIIGDLQGAGIKARIQGGTIKVTEDSIIVKVGEHVPSNVVPVLARLGIEPMEILLKLNAAHEAGTIYTYDILHIDEQETFAKFCDAATKAFNLSFNSRMFTQQTIPLLLAKAACDGYCAGCADICESAVGGKIPVSDVMRYLMYYNEYGDQAGAREKFASLPAAVRSQLASVDYTAAQRGCPQNLPIAELMAEASVLLA